ncbi:hypothetical protein DL98DRAFT_516808 [Cadophora sp. DSE1049]|nr:hypothetical protein DL98DRAFT_516808 [Cadophora sp. DSE1049]
MQFDGAASLPTLLSQPPSRLDLVLSISTLVPRNFPSDTMPDHTASGANGANVSKTCNNMADRYAPNIHPTGQNWDTAKIHEHIASAVSGRGDTLVMGPTSEDVLFLTEFLAREFSQKTEMVRAVGYGDAQAQQALALHEEHNKTFAKSMLSTLEDDKYFNQSTMYRVATITLVLAVYGDGHKYPADPEFAQSYAVRACEIIRLVRMAPVSAENKTAVDLLYNTIQNLAWSRITQPQVRLFCRLTGHLMYKDPLDPKADDEPELDWGAQMRRRKELTTRRSADGLKSASQQDKPSGS